MPPRSAFILGSVALAIAFGLPATLTAIDDPIWRSGLSLAALVAVYLLGLFTPPPPRDKDGKTLPPPPKT